MIGALRGNLSKLYEIPYFGNGVKRPDRNVWLQTEEYPL